MFGNLISVIYNALVVGYTRNNPSEYSAADVRLIIQLQRRIRMAKKTRWERICGNYETKDVEELRVIAKRQGVVSVSTKTKRELCADLARAFELKPLAHLIFSKGLGYNNQIEMIFQETKTISLPSISVSTMPGIEGFFRYKTTNNDPRKGHLEFNWDWKQEKDNELYLSSKEDYVILPLSLFFDSFSGFNDLTIEETKEWIENEYTSAHQNVVIIDKVRGIAFRYEPYYLLGENIQVRINKILVDALEKRFKVSVQDTSIFGRNGVQSIYQGELCVLYCAYFVHLFLKSESWEIALDVIREKTDQDSYMTGFLVFIRNLVKNLGRDFFIRRLDDPAIDMLPTIACVVCGQNASLMCENCQNQIEPYCSIVCFQDHWPCHIIDCKHFN